MIATTEEGLQQLLNEINSNAESKGLSINHKKTKCMVISKSETPPTCTLKLGDIKIEQVENFNYLCSVVTSNSRCKKEIRRWISLAKEALKKMKPILCDRKLLMPIKNRVIQTFVWPVILYGSESWTLNSETRKNIEAAEMWFCRCMLKISWVVKVTNDEVLNRVQKERQLLQRIEHGQNKFQGHIIHKEAIEDLCLNGKIPGKKAREGQRLHFLHFLVISRCKHS